MASSGTIYGPTLDGGYRLEIDWSATQDSANNKSTVTAKVYWHSLGSYYTINSSDTKTGRTKIDGTTYSWSVSGAHLKGNERRLLSTKSKTVTHDSDGTKSLTISATFDCEVTLGKYVSSTTASKSVTLNTIPREWKLASSVNFTAGNNLPLSFNVTSKSFSVTVEVDVNGTQIKKVSGITSSSYTMSFSTGDVQNILTQLNKDTKSWNQTVDVYVTTYSGSTKIGSTKHYTGTCSSPSVTTVSGANFTIGDTTTITFGSEANTNFVYDVTATIGSYTKTLATKADRANISWNTANDATSLYSQLPSSNTGSIKYTVTTYWKNGTTYTKIRTPYTTGSYTVRVNTTTQKPTFPTSGTVTYKDISTTASKTNNNQYIVQSKSTLQITLPAAKLATPPSGTRISKYQATFNGHTVDSTASSLTADQIFTFTADQIDTGTTQDATIQAIDSRGNVGSISVPITIVPYKPPKIVVSATRDDGFSTPVTIKLSGSISPVTIGTNNTNKVVSMTYNWSLAGQNKWQASESPFTAASATFPNYAAVDAHLATQLDFASAWDVRITVTDNYGSYTSITTVGVGVPILFIDSVLSSLGFNDVPKNPNEIMVNGSLRFGSNKWASSGGALVMGNGDITEANGIYFKDVADNNGEGLLFAKYDTPAGSTNRDDYNNLAIDGNGYITYNGRPIYKDSASMIMPPGDDSTQDFWYNVPAGTYFCTPGTLTHQPKSYGFVQVFRRDRNDFTALWFTQSKGPIYRKSGNSSSITDWVLINSGFDWQLWSGALLMSDQDTIYPSVPLSQCPNGWVLLWAQYDNGTAKKWANTYTIVHKSHLDDRAGQGVICVTSTQNTFGIDKYVYVNDTWIKGNVNNSKNNQVALQKVLMW